MRHSVAFKCANDAKKHDPNVYFHMEPGENRPEEESNGFMPWIYIMDQNDQNDQNDHELTSCILSFCIWAKFRVCFCRPALQPCVSVLMVQGIIQCTDFCLAHRNPSDTW